MKRITMKPKNEIHICDGIAGLDMRLKLHGEMPELTILLMGAMQVDPGFREVVNAAVKFFPAWSEAVGVTISKDFNGNIHQ